MIAMDCQLIDRVEPVDWPPSTFGLGCATEGLDGLPKYQFVIRRSLRHIACGVFDTTTIGVLQAFVHRYLPTPSMPFACPSILYIRPFVSR